MSADYIKTKIFQKSVNYNAFCLHGEVDGLSQITSKQYKKKKKVTDTTELMWEMSIN